MAPQCVHTMGLAEDRATREPSTQTFTIKDLLYKLGLKSTGMTNHSIPPVL